MPRSVREIEAGVIYHVLNRGNGRMNLFHKDQDFAAFEAVLSQGLERYPVDLLTYCLMNNHWHLLLRPRRDRALSELMRWIGVTHVRRHHAHFHARGGGHLYQGRFKSFPVQNDEHFLTVCRHIEANAVRAGATRDAANWRWCGVYARGKPGKPLKLTPWPLDRPRNWSAILNGGLEEPTLKRIRESVNRGRPFGEESWVHSIAERLGLQSTLRKPGRPRREPAK
jgi:REP-associated tyrosine transposase